MRDNRLEIPSTAAVKRRTGRGNKRPGADQETNQPGCPISSPGRLKGHGALRTKTVANLGTANGHLCPDSGARRGGIPIGVPGSGTAWPTKFQMHPLDLLAARKHPSLVAGCCNSIQRVTWCRSICRACCPSSSTTATATESRLGSRHSAFPLVPAHGTRTTQQRPGSESQDHGRASAIIVFCGVIPT